MLAPAGSHCRRSSTARWLPLYTVNVQSAIQVPVLRAGGRLAFTTNEVETVIVRIAGGGAIALQQSVQVEPARPAERQLSAPWVG